MHYLKIILISYLSPCKLFQTFTNLFKSLTLLPLLKKINIILGKIVAISQIPSISYPDFLILHIKKNNRIITTHFHTFLPVTEDELFIIFFLGMISPPVPWSLYLQLFHNLTLTSCIFNFCSDTVGSLIFCIVKSLTFLSLFPLFPSTVKFLKRILYAMVFKPDYILESHGELWDHTDAQSPTPEILTQLV